MEVRLLERGATLVKVDWPRGFEHLEAWTYVTDIVEELPNPTQRLSAELERWLSTLGDAEGTRPLPTAGEPDAPDSADATESVAAGTPAE